MENKNWVSLKQQSYIPFENKYLQYQQINKFQLPTRFSL